MTNKETRKNLSHFYQDFQMMKIIVTFLTVKFGFVANLVFTFETWQSHGNCPHL